MPWRPRSSSAATGGSARASRRRPEPFGSSSRGGDLTGTYPAPTIAAAQAPVSVADNPSTATDPCTPSAVGPATMVLCGTTSSRWLNGGFGLPGLQVWRDQIGQVHIRGSVTLSTGMTTSAPTLFVLPAGLRPKRIVSFHVATTASAGLSATGSALLIVYSNEVAGADGFVGLFDPSAPTQQAVHLGDIVFRTDA